MKWNESDGKRKETVELEYFTYTFCTVGWEQQAGFIKDLDYVQIDLLNMLWLES